MLAEKFVSGATAVVIRNSPGNPAQAGRQPGRDDEADIDAQAFGACHAQFPILLTSTLVAAEDAAMARPAARVGEIATDALAVVACGPPKAPGKSIPLSAKPVGSVAPCCDDSLLEICNSHVEDALRGVAVGRGTLMFIRSFLQL